MTRWIGLACALILVTGTAAFFYQMLPEPVPEPTIELHPRNEGPPPRLEVVGETHYEFGTLLANTKGSHTWAFKNVGEGPLDVWLEETSCSCTVATLKTADGEPKKTVTVPPGGSTPIELTWEGRRWDRRYGQSATLGTNDPDNPRVTLTVLGKILAPVEVRPSEAIDFAEISSEEPHRATISIVSGDRPEVKLTRLASSRPGLIVADARTMASAELEKLKVKSGYELTVEVKPGLPAGRFNEELIIETDHPDRSSLKVGITGRSVGPISVVPERLRMSSVASKVGATQDITLLVRGGRKTRFDVVSKPKKLEVAISPEDRPGAKGKYRMTVTVPPGLSPGLVDEPIVLKTDHPKAGELRIPVMIYISSRSEAG
jgi:hypothetical protein